jgi:hypothetical protein
VSNNQICSRHDIAEDTDAFVTQVSLYNAIGNTMSVGVDICEIFITSIGSRPGDREMENNIFWQKL